MGNAEILPSPPPAPIGEEECWQGVKKIWDDIHQDKIDGLIIGIWNQQGKKRMDSMIER
jgi:hypothetical protein